MGRSSVTYQVKRCPYCRKAYSEREDRGGYAKDAFVVFGPLFAECPSCLHSFRDPDAVELAIMDPPEFYLEEYPAASFFAAIFFAVLGLVSTVISHDISGLFGALVLSAGILLVCRLRYSTNLKTVEKERALSIERLKHDPAYALTLKTAGFSVPEEYLPKAGTASPDPCMLEIREASVEFSHHRM